MIKADHLHYDYLTYEEEGKAPRIFHALKDIDLEVLPGQFIAVLGHNGSGKSTFARQINALLTPSEGTMWVDGMDTRDESKLWEIRQRAGMVFQNPDNQIVAAVVEEDVGFGPENLGVPTPKIWERVEHSLQKTGMLAFRRKSPNHLSGGQKQRVAIAGVLAMESRCIVLDEPTAMLDPAGRREVLEAVRELNRLDGVTIILITHYMEEVLEADRIFVMDQGEIALSGSPAEVFSQAELLKQLHLDVPQSVQLANLLRQKGLVIPAGILRPAELAEALTRNAKEDPSGESTTILTRAVKEGETSEKSLTALMRNVKEGESPEKTATSLINAVHAENPLGKSINIRVSAADAEKLSGRKTNVSMKAEEGEDPPARSTDAQKNSSQMTSEMSDTEYAEHPGLGYREVSGSHSVINEGETTGFSVNRAVAAGGTSSRISASALESHLQPLLQLENVSYTYGKGGAAGSAALKGVSLTLYKGQFVGIIGHTGSGKSTLIQQMNALLKPTQGRVLFDGQDIWGKEFDRKQLRFHVGLVFQYPEYQLFESDIITDVMFGPKNQGKNEADCRKAAEEALTLCGIGPDLYDKSPFELSGGQKRRAAIAGILAMEPQILVLDEPTAGLDPQGRDEMLQQIARLQRERGITVCLVSHSMEDVARYADRLIVMSEGQLTMDDTPRSIFADAAALEEMGLSVPEVCSVLLECRRGGLPVSGQAITVEEAAEEILSAIDR